MSSIFSLLIWKVSTHKLLPFASICKVLGVQLDLRQSGDSLCLISNTTERVEELVQDIANILSARALPKAAVAARAVGLDRRAAAGTLRLRLWLCGSRAVWVYMSVYGCCVVVAAVGLRLALRLRFCSCGCDCAAVSPRRSAVHSYIMAVWLWRGGCGCAVVAAAVGLWRLAAALALQLRLRAVWLLGCMAVVGFGCVVARQAFMPFGFLHVKSHVDIGF